MGRGGGGGVGSGVLLNLSHNDTNSDQSVL